MKLTCIMCPVGCELDVKKDGEKIVVSGNGCIRGERYGITEITAPARMITALIKTKIGVASVKTTNLVPKAKIFDVLNELQNFFADEVKDGQIIIKNVAGIENVDVVVTREAINNEQ